MCVHACLCVYVYMFCVCVCMFVCICENMCNLACTCIYMCVYTFVYMCLCLCINMLWGKQQSLSTPVKVLAIRPAALPNMCSRAVKTYRLLQGGRVVTAELPCYMRKGFSETDIVLTAWSILLFFLKTY